MDEQVLARMGRERLRKFWSALALTGLGLLAAGVGFAIGQARSGDAATGWGALAGVGASFVVVGIAVAWLNRPGDRRWMTEASQGRRERLQAGRSRQLFLYPVVALVFLLIAIDPVRQVVAGDGRLRDLLSILLPVVYAWLTAAVAMGWDAYSWQNRRFLEDELTVVIRARAMVAAFFVLMTGSTLSLALLLVRPELGVIALLVSLAAAGCTAGARFAWLDHEAGQDG
ncbi:MAG: hypothetical protein KKG14_08300 [Alphaproteobacteria bacterium]|nr:hypothetical protein [Alphaproteobacteria bacterium]